MIVRPLIVVVGLVYMLIEDSDAVMVGGYLYFFRTSMASYLYSLGIEIIRLKAHRCLFASVP